MATKWYNGLDLQSQRLINLATPSSSSDGSTKGYVDQWIPLQTVMSSPSGAISSATLTSVLNVGAVAAGTYAFEFYIGLVGNATTSTPGINLSGTMVTSSYRFMVNFISNNALASSVSTNQSGTTLASTGLALGALGTNTSQQGLSGAGTFVVGTGGTAGISMSVTAGTGTFTVRTGSGLIVSRLS